MNGQSYLCDRKNKPRLTPPKTSRQRKLTAGNIRQTAPSEHSDGAVWRVSGFQAYWSTTFNALSLSAQTTATTQLPMIFTGAFSSDIAAAGP